MLRSFGGLFLEPMKESIFLPARFSCGAILSGGASLVFLFLLLAPFAFGQAPSLLEQGIAEYKKENYEEAAEILARARAQDPASSMAAFFLGLTCKIIGDYPQARSSLEAAVTLSPPIKEGLVELIDVLQQTGLAEEAEKWIGVAEREKIYPAKTAFLKGLVLAQRGRNAEAIASFERAKEADPSLAQAADFQIGLGYLRDRKLKKSRERFRAAIIQDGTTDLAAYARNYQDILERRIFLERPLRLTLGVFGGYDTNVVLKPIDAAAAPGVTDERSPILNSNLRADYVPVLEGPWLFNATYVLSSNLHQKHSTSHDSLANTISLIPGYNFGDLALNLVASYSHVLVRDPSYKRYLEVYSAGPLLRTLLNANHILELFAGYNRKNYFRPSLRPEEDRDGYGGNAYASWVWLFRSDSFLNLKYEYSYEKTRGIWWENQGNRFTANVVLPLIHRLRLQGSGDVFLQDYRYENAAFNDTKRRDRIYTANLGLTWDVSLNISFILQYTRTWAQSNITIYDYTRDVYLAGMEFRL